MIFKGLLSEFSPEENSVIAPLGVIRPIAGVVPSSVNHRAPSGPPVMLRGLLSGFSPAVNSVMVPLCVIRPIALVAPSTVNHRLPSAPGAMDAAPLLSPAVNSVIAPGAAAAALPTHRGDTVAASDSDSAASPLTAAPARTPTDRPIKAMSPPSPPSHRRLRFRGNIQSG